MENKKSVYTIKAGRYNADKVYFIVDDKGKKVKKEGKTVFFYTQKEADEYAKSIFKDNKKEMWESKLAGLSNKSLTEAYSDMASAIMPDGIKVMAVGSTRHTRTYNYEDVTFRFGNKEGRGSYRWQNRPWQRFDFADALIGAMKDAGVEDKFARECIEKTNGLDRALDYFAQNYKKTAPVAEATKLKEEVSGWIAILDGKKVEIKKGEADSLYGAKKLAIKKFAQLFGRPLSKAKELQISIGPAYEDDVKDAPASNVQFESKKLKESHIPSFSELDEWCMGDVVEMIKTIHRMREDRMNDGDRLVFQDFSFDEYSKKELNKILDELEDMVMNYLYGSGDYLPIEIEQIEKKIEKINESVLSNKDKNLEEDLKIIIDISQYEPWSGAVDTFNKIEEEDLMTEFEQLMEDIYPDGLTKTELNDILWFDGDMILKQLGIEVEDDEEEEDEEEMED